MYSEDDVDLIIRRDIGERMRDRRNEVGLSQTDLARRLGTSQREISRWENGDARPTGFNLHRVARELGCDWRLLAYGTLERSIP